MQKVNIKKIPQNTGTSFEYKRLLHTGYYAY